MQILKKFEKYVILSSISCWRDVTMDITACFMILIPIILFSYYTFLSQKKLPNEYNIKLIRRVYYLFAVIYISVFIFIYHDEINQAEIIQVDHVGSRFLNYFLLLAAAVIAAILWDYLFISCRSLKTFKFKDMELNISDLDQVKYVDKTQDKQISYLDSVLNAKLEMVKYIDHYVENTELNPDESYKDIISAYEHKRKNIKVHVYYDDEIDQMAKELHIEADMLSSLLFSMNLLGYCIPKGFRKKDYIFAKYKTKYTKRDIIIVLVSDFLVDNEHSMLFDAVYYFEVLIALNILQAEKENTCVQHENPVL
jgi:hypothetical protein